MYGLYYSFDGRRWYYAGEHADYDTVLVAARATAKLHGASRGQVRDEQDNVLWMVYA